MRDAGQMRARCRIDRRRQVNPDAPEDFGNVRDEWVPLLEVWCSTRAPATLRDGEAEMGGVTQTTLRIEVRLRAGPMTRGITAADRITFTAGPLAGQSANIGLVNPTPDGADIILIVTIGEVP
jgi:head-tail adaptor